MARIEVDVHIDAAELEKAYSGASSVYATSVDGRRIQFPMKILWRFITHSGIHGRFLIHFDGSGKFEHIERIY